MTVIFLTLGEPRRETGFREGDWLPGGKRWFQDHGQWHGGHTSKLLCLVLPMVCGNAALYYFPDTMFSTLVLGASLVIWTVTVLHLVSRNPHRILHSDLKTHFILWNVLFSLDMLHRVNAIFWNTIKNKNNKNLRPSASNHQWNKLSLLQTGLSRNLRLNFLTKHCKAWNHFLK